MGQASTCFSTCHRTHALALSPAALWTLRVTDYVLKASDGRTRVHLRLSCSHQKFIADEFKKKEAVTQRRG